MHQYGVLQMSAAQTAIKIWILIEKFDNDVDVTPFTSRNSSTDSNAAFFVL